MHESLYVRIYIYIYIYVYKYFELCRPTCVDRDEEKFKKVKAKLILVNEPIDFFG